MNAFGNKNNYYYRKDENPKQKLSRKEMQQLRNGNNPKVTKKKHADYYSKYIT